MAASSQPRIVSFLAGGTIVSGHAVKLSAAAGDTVIECTANGDKSIGIAQSAASSGQVVEVAVNGGGAKAKLGEAVTYGNHLVSHTDGTLVMVNATSDFVVAQAMQSGSSGDIIAVEVVKGSGFAAES